MEEIRIEDTGYVSKGQNSVPYDAEKEAEELVKKFGFNPTKLANALLELGQKMTGIKLYSYQRGPAFRIIYSVLVHDGSEITMLFSRQSGKTEVISLVVFVLAVFMPVFSKIFPEQLGHFKFGAKMGAFAPQLEQVETLYMRCLEKLWSDTTRMYLSDPDINDAPMSKVNYKLRSGSTLKAQSGARQSKIESKSYHIVFIDESQDMDTDKVRKSIIPMTASTFGTIVRLGTPNRVKGDFYYTIQNNKRKDRALAKAKKATEQLHFEYDYKAIFKARQEQYDIDKNPYHLLYQSAVERDKLSMGAKSDQFRLSYALEWLFEVGMFITDERLEKHVFDKRLKFPDLTSKESFNVAGLDIASARASTVLTIGSCTNEVTQGYEDLPLVVVGKWVELKNTNYEDQFHIIHKELVDNNVKILYADYTGVGRAFTDRILAYLGDQITIIPYTFTPVSKSDMWKSLDEAIDLGRILVPAHESVRSTPEFNNFSEQMVNLQKTWKGSYMVCDKTQGYLDDYCDSLGLLNLASCHLYIRAQDISVSSNILVPSVNDYRHTSSW